MAMRKTPFLRLRYPWASDVVSAADVDAMASDVDQALVQTAQLAANFSRFASVAVRRSATQSLTKATLTAISFDTPLADNGANSPLANGKWFDISNPTRLTAPTACIVLAIGQGSFTTGTAMGTNGAYETVIALNGGTAGAGVQGSKWAPSPTITGAQVMQAISMWKLAAGDFLELKQYWTGTPAGPITTNGSFSAGMPSLSLMMVGLPTVA